MVRQCELNTKNIFFGMKQLFRKYYTKKSDLVSHQRALNNNPFRDPDGSRDIIRHHTSTLNQFTFELKYLTHS